MTIVISTWMIVVAVQTLIAIIAAAFLKGATAYTADDTISFVACVWAAWVAPVLIVALT